MRLSKGDRVVFTSPQAPNSLSDVALDGIILDIRGADLLVGVQDAERPYVHQWDYKREYWAKVPNNSVWVVPIGYVVHCTAKGVSVEKPGEETTVAA